MGIADRNLAPGTRLVATYKKETHRAEVVAGEDGKLRYRLADGREFKSPSAAGTAITGKACNGWSFWSVDVAQQEQPPEATVQDPTDQEHPEATEEKPADRAQPESEATEAPELQPSAETAPQPVVVGFRRVPNQRGVPEGEVRLYCDTCRESFTAPAGQMPETCPQGHRPGDAGAEEEPHS